jgi:hypothetical protein
MAVLTKAQLALCAAMFGTGMVAPPAVKKVKAVYSKPAPSKPKVSATPVSPREPMVIAQEPVLCIPSVQGEDGSIIAAPPTQTFGAPYILTPPTNAVIPDGGGGGSLPPVTPGIPEPDTWVMLVLGFGFLGLSLRRRKREEVSQ